MTNPDNVGGLVWYVCTTCLLMVQLPSDTPTLGRCQCSPGGYSLLRARLPKGYELCRAAPAGGDKSCTFAHGDDWPCSICGTPRKDSAPAGSGEVEKLVRSARAIIDHAVHGEPVSLQDAHDKLTEAAALLRKLQQGADGWRPIESAPKGDRRVVLLVSNNGPNGYITDPWTGWVNSDGSFARWPHNFPPTHWMAISQKYPARAASQGQEGGNG